MTNGLCCEGKDWLLHHMIMVLLVFTYDIVLFLCCFAQFFGNRAIASNTVAAEAIRGLQEQWSARALELRREEKEAEVQLVMRYVAEQYEAVMRTHSDTELRQRFRQLLSQLGYTCGSLTAATLMVVSQREILATEREKVSHLEQENKTLKDDLVKNEEKRKNLEIELGTQTKHCCCHIYLCDILLFCSYVVSHLTSVLPILNHYIIRFFLCS